MSSSSSFEERDWWHQADGDADYVEEEEEEEESSGEEEEEESSFSSCSSLDLEDMLHSGVHYDRSPERLNDYDANIMFASVKHEERHAERESTYLFDGRDGSCEEQDLLMNQDAVLMALSSSNSVSEFLSQGAVARIYAHPIRVVIENAGNGGSLRGEGARALLYRILQEGSNVNFMSNAYSWRCDLCGLARTSLYAVSIGEYEEPHAAGRVCFQLAHALANFGALVQAQLGSGQPDVHALDVALQDIQTAKLQQ